MRRSRRPRSCKHKKFPGPACHWRWCCHLCTTWVSPSQWHRGSPKGRKVGHSMFDLSRTLPYTSILRYCNMDYVVFSALRNFKFNEIGLSYDIACQWGQKLRQRLKHLPSDFQLNGEAVKIHFFIPKFHLPCHKLECQSKFSFNLRCGVGRTDGEGIERDWSIMNMAASTTKEMGEGCRHDALDDYWGDWNYRKTLTFGA